jgi:hypothetical protein
MHARMIATKSKRATPQEKEPLQVRIPIDVKRAFKSAAALRGMEPNELFIEMWYQYQHSHDRAMPAQGPKK